MKITPVILSGGTGSRLWPLSRRDYPKQFLPLFSEKTLLQETALRFQDSTVYAAPIVIGNEAHRFAIAEQLQEVGVKATIILEPMGKNTAPAAAIASLLQSEKQTLLLIVSSDHIIQHVEAFHTAVQDGIEAANQGAMVSIGVTATSPETGYGYIECETARSERTFTIKSFVEKPDSTRAQQFVEAGTHLWNAGIFLFQAQTYLRELQKSSLAMLEACTQTLAEAVTDLDFIRLEKASFETITADSIDYAVMEKQTNAVVVAAVGMGWSDIGSWKALSEIAPKDGLGNVCLGDILTQNASGNYLRSEGKQLITAIGIENLAVVATKDAILVCPLDQSQEVKKIVDHLNQQGRTEAAHHRLVYRPWGTYEGIDEGDRYQVKRIVVKPGQKLSLQKHYHRAEHWVVVHGTALVTREQEEILLKENESVYLPLGAVHRLENLGKIPLVLVEVQSGSYLGEDDIVRFQDTYGRVS